MPVGKKHCYYFYYWIHLPDSQENIRNNILRATVKQLFRPAFGNTKIMLSGFNFCLVFCLEIRLKSRTAANHQSEENAVKCFWQEHYRIARVCFESRPNRSRLTFSITHGASHHSITL